MFLVIARFAFGCGKVFAGARFRFPLAGIGLGKKFDSLFHLPDGVQIFVQFILIVAPKAISQSACVIEHEIEQGLAIFFPLLVPVLRRGSR